ncbi:membrane peptidoglycan carboxypeptidase [Nocardiopsis sp. Huas11]|uniref:transglycosylase domain-containing protein n=1 Tax=Nocardiopsis sp. Huas11 TaxID=2183912 RepID=UPI000F164AED|nr:transglycosylase domain-containing protein [Nocardiopsis sp. Huas11]RKS10654.1 membrane peptidoglycan carboxypeptidase [Nocardiopsis sp. Huas11]
MTESSGNGEHEKTRTTALLRLTGTAAMAGVLCAALVLPWVGAIGVAGRDVASAFMSLPADLDPPPLSERILLTDADDEPIAEVARRERDLVELDEISPWVPAALMAIEDERFYEHNGLDLRGVLRALLRTAQGDLQGGSTITQQYVKNLLIENAATEEELDRANERTVGRKLVELRHTMGIEERMTKDEIMEGYLNLSYFGSGAHGIEIAARRYFSVPAADLDPAQAALLVGLVRGPSYYDPMTNPDAAIERRDVVLDRMADTGHLTAEQAQEYKGTGLDLEPTERGGSCYSSDYPFFCDYVMHWLTASDLLGETEEERDRALEQGGFTVRTTLDRDAQEAAQDAVDRYVPHEDSTKFAAEAVVEPGNGKVRAMAQNLRYGFDEEDTGTTSINLAVDRADGGSHGFQAGSTFKAFTLAAALDKGLGYGTSFSAPKSTTVSGLRNCEGGRMSDWEVRNAGESDEGRHNMISGTKGSVNTYFAQLQRRVGLCETSQMAEDAGIARADGEPLGVWSSFTLGDQEVSPLTVANAYATFAADGTRCEPRPVEVVSENPVDPGSGRIEVGSTCEEEAVSPKVAAGVSHLLQQTFKGGTADGLGIGRPAAGKTGTTDSAAYAWFAGYTPNLAAAVAVGDVRGGEENPLQGVVIGGRHYGIVYGGTLPGPIWQATMREATADLPTKSFPSSPSAFGDPGAQPPQPRDGGDDDAEDGT